LDVGTINATLSENLTFFFGRDNRVVDESIDVVVAVGFSFFFSTFSTD